MLYYCLQTDVAMHCGIILLFYDSTFLYPILSLESLVQYNRGMITYEYKFRYIDVSLKYECPINRLTGNENFKTEELNYFGSLS